MEGFVTSSSSRTHHMLTLQNHCSQALHSNAELFELLDQKKSDRLLEQKIHRNGVGVYALERLTIPVCGIVEYVHNTFRKPDLRREFKEWIVQVEPKPEISIQTSSFYFQT